MPAAVITLALARLAKGDFDPDVAVRGIFIATTVNTLAKVGLVAVITGGAMAVRVALALAAAVAAGGVVLLAG